MERVNAVYYFVLSLVSVGRKLALFPWLRNNMVHCIHYEVILYSSPFKGCGCFRYSRDSLEMPPDFMSVYLPERLLHVWAVACLDSLDSLKFTHFALYFVLIGQILGGVGTSTVLLSLEKLVC